METRVGLISDTHGLMRPEALAALHGVAMILHAGDVGALSVLRELEGLAPVHAVYGNVDDPAFGLPAHCSLSVEGVSFHVTHGHELRSLTPEALVQHYRADVVIYGHTHKSLIRRVGSTLVVNPGAAGPKRFNVQPSVALVSIVDGHPSARIIPLST